MDPVKKSVNAALASNTVASILANDLQMLIESFRAGSLSAEEFVASVGANAIVQLRQLNLIDATLFTKE